MRDAEGRPEIGLLMTTGMSLQKWAEAGFLDRELSIYGQLADRLDARVVFLSYGGEDEVEHLKGDSRFGVVPCAAPRFGGLTYSALMGPILGDTLRRLRLIKTNQMRGAWAGLYPRFRYGVPLLVRCGYEWLDQVEARGVRSPLGRRAVAGVEHVVYRGADAIMLPGAHLRDFVHRRLGIDPGKVHVFLNSIDLQRFRPMDGLDPIAGRVVWVGRLDPIKQLDLLIGAVARIEGCELVLVGDGPLRQELEELARDVGARVRFYGKVPNSTLPEVLGQGSVFALTSDWEGNPKALMEAMACGRPCLGTDKPGITALIEDGVNGVIVGSSVEGIEEGLRRLLGDRDEAEAMGAKARAFAEEWFDLELNLDREAELMRGLMRG